MMVVGSRLYGKIDRLSNGWFVATKFAHVNYFPLIPSGTMLVTQQNGRTWRGVPLPISPRSIAMAYTRALACLVGFGGFILPLVILQGHPSTAESAFSIVGGTLMVGIAIGSFLFWRRASADREQRWLKIANISSISGDLPPARGFDVMPAPVVAEAIPTTTATASSSPPPMRAS